MNWFKLSQLDINTSPEDVLIYYRGTALPLDNFTGEEMFTDHKAFLMSSPEQISLLGEK